MSINKLAPEQLQPGYWTEDRLKSAWNYEYEENQLYPELLGVQSLCPWPGTVSSSRAQMFGSHIGQRLSIKSPTIRRILTGMEAEYGKVTFSKRIPKNCRIVETINFYNAGTRMTDDIKANPESVVIYETEGPNSEIGFISLTDFCSNHPYFGFRYQTPEEGKFLGPNRFLKEGTILRDSPAIDAQGNYKYGIQLPTYFSTLPSGAEDGIEIAKSIAPFLTVSTFDKRRGGWGSNTWPINLYGTKDRFKPFPEIGDYVRSDALLMAFRKYEGGCCPVEMSMKAAMEHSATYDTLLYADGPGGRVIDIRVYKDGASQSYAPDMCNEQAVKYDKARREFYEKILKVYNRLDYSAGKGKLRMTDEFSNLVETAIKVTTETAPRQQGQKKLEQRIQNLHRGAPMDDWVIEFVIQYDRMPVVGGKLTDTVGGKGVIVKITPDEDMPIDEAGNRALVAMDSNATISRMNIARFYEQYMNACSRDFTKEICAYFGVTPPPIHGQRLTSAKKMEVVRKYSDGDAASIAFFARLCRYFRIIVPKQAEMYEGILAANDKIKMADHICHLLEDGIYLHHPTDNAPELHDVITQLKAEFPAHKSRITFRGNSGKMRTTKDKHLIGDVYFLLLEKTGGDWSAVSSAKVQGFGTICQLTNQDKNSSPVRRQGIRAYGETEVRIILACLGPYITNVLLDRNNNLEAHKFGVRNILSADKPTNIKQLVDYNQVTLGGSRSLELVHHLLFCGGLKFTYDKYQEGYQRADFSGLAMH